MDGRLAKFGSGAEKESKAKPSDGCRGKVWLERQPCKKTNDDRSQEPQLLAQLATPSQQISCLRAMNVRTYTAKKNYGRKLFYRRKSHNIEISHRASSHRPVGPEYELDRIYEVRAP